MRAAFLDISSLSPCDLDITPLQDCVDDLVCYDHTAPEEVLERLQGVDIAVVNKVVLSAQILRQLPALKHIIIAATGANNIDLADAQKLGISVQNCQAYGVDSVAQHTLMLMLALSTRLLDYRQAIQAGEWSRSRHFCLLDYPVESLAGKTLGIVGYGELGQGVARLATAFGMQVLVATRPGQPSQNGRIALAELLPQVDILSLHCPLTPTTQGLIGEPQLQAMRSSALLINCARGGIVDEQALLKALISKQIAGAATDVLSVEPPPADHPLLQYQHNNLIITPHSAWASRTARQTIVQQLAQNIISLTSSRPQFLLS
ncbi:MAG: 2-hydroxyacid dehydrogenase [Gammaproteobacteria bacterium]|nr:2-hydroxyacid dehydrogenase [Gammaproteobacteria bacterium]